MAEIINLRLARKKKRRADEEKRAVQNREKFGLSKADRKLAKKEKSNHETIVNGAKLDKE